MSLVKDRNWTEEVDLTLKPAMFLVQKTLRPKSSQNTLNEVMQDSDGPPASRYCEAQELVLENTGVLKHSKFVPWQSSDNDDSADTLVIDEVEQFDMNMKAFDEELAKLQGEETAGHTRIYNSASFSPRKWWNEVGGHSKVQDSASPAFKIPADTSVTMVGSDRGVHSPKETGDSSQDNVYGYASRRSSACVPLCQLQGRRSSVGLPLSDVIRQRTSGADFPSPRRELQVRSIR